MSISSRLAKVEKLLIPKRSGEVDPQILKAIVNKNNKLNEKWAKFDEIQKALWILRFNTDFHRYLKRHSSTPNQERPATELLF